VTAATRANGRAGSHPTIRIEFNEQYGKWVDSRQKNDRDDIDKHARKMEEIMARYNIPPDTPFDVMATSTGNDRHYDYREFQGRFSPDDQKKFDHEYREWQEERREVIAREWQSTKGRCKS
jgi:hypothetical protein